MSDNLYAELQSFKVKANADVLDLNVVGTPRAALNAQTFTPRPPPSSNASASSNSKRFLASKPRVQLSIESAPRSSLLEIRAAKLAKDKADLEAAEAAAAAEKERLRVEREIAANSMTRAARRWVRLKLVIRIGGASKFRSSMAEFDAVANAEGTFTDETATEESYLGQEGSEEHRRQTAEAAAVAAQLNVPIDCKSNEVFKFESSDKLPLWHATVLTPPETRLQADCEHLALLLMPLSFNCFKDLTLSTMTAIAKKMRYQTFTPMSLMCKAGEPGFIAYFIISGSASVLIRPAGAEFDICVKRFGAGFSVGEPSLHNPDAIRSATLRADLTPLEVLTLSRADYQTAINSGAALTRSAEDEFAAEARVAKEREMQEALAKVSAIPVDTKVGSNFRFQSSSARPRWFTTVSKPCVQRNEEDCYHVGTLLADLGLDCFKTYTPDMFRSMVSRMTFDTLPPFYTICKTGEAARTAYIVLSGSVSVLIRPKGAPADICVKRFGPGYSFGEPALFRNDATRSATIRTDAEPMECLIISRADYLAVGREELKRRLDAKLGYFQYHALFQRWPRAKLLALATAATERTLFRNSFVYQAGQVPSCLAFSRDGEFELIASPFATCRTLQQHVDANEPPPVSEEEERAALMASIAPPRSKQHAAGQTPAEIAADEEAKELKRAREQYASDSQVLERARAIGMHKSETLVNVGLVSGREMLFELELVTNAAALAANMSVSTQPLQLPQHGSVQVRSDRARLFELPIADLVRLGDEELFRALRLYAIDRVRFHADVIVKRHQLMSTLPHAPPRALAEHRTLDIVVGSTYDRQGVNRSPSPTAASASELVQTNMPGAPAPQDLFHMHGGAWRGNPAQRRRMLRLHLALADHENAGDEQDENGGNVAENANSAASAAMISTRLANERIGFDPTQSVQQATSSRTASAADSHRPESRAMSAAGFRATPNPQSSDDAALLSKSVFWSLNQTQSQPNLSAKQSAIATARANATAAALAMLRVKTAKAHVRKLKLASFQAAAPFFPSSRSVPASPATQIAAVIADSKKTAEDRRAILNKIARTQREVSRRDAARYKVAAARLAAAAVAFAKKTEGGIDPEDDESDENETEEDDDEDEADEDEEQHDEVEHEEQRESNPDLGDQQPHGEENVDNSTTDQSKIDQEASTEGQAVSNSDTVAPESIPAIKVDIDDAAHPSTQPLQPRSKPVRSARFSTPTISPESNAVDEETAIMMWADDGIGSPIIASQKSFIRTISSESLNEFGLAEVPPPQPPSPHNPLALTRSVSQPTASTPTAAANPFGLSKVKSVPSPSTVANPFGILLKQSSFQSNQEVQGGAVSVTEDSVFAESAIPPAVKAKNPFGFGKPSDQPPTMLRTKSSKSRFKVNMATNAALASSAQNAVVMDVDAAFAETMETSDEEEDEDGESDVPPTDPPIVEPEGEQMLFPPARDRVHKPATSAVTQDEVEVVSITEQPIQIDDQHPIFPTRRVRIASSPKPDQQNSGAAPKLSRRRSKAPDVVRSLNVERTGLTLEMVANLQKFNEHLHDDHQRAQSLAELFTSAEAAKQSVSTEAMNYGSRGGPLLPAPSLSRISQFALASTKSVFEAAIQHQHALIPPLGAAVAPSHLAPDDPMSHVHAPRTMTTSYTRLHLPNSHYLFAPAPSLVHAEQVTRARALRIRADARAQARAEARAKAAADAKRGFSRAQVLGKNAAANKFEAPPVPQVESTTGAKQTTGQPTLITKTVRTQTAAEAAAEAARSLSDAQSFSSHLLAHQGSLLQRDFAGRPPQHAVAESERTLSALHSLPLGEPVLLQTLLTQAQSEEPMAALNVHTLNEIATEASELRAAQLDAQQTQQRLDREYGLRTGSVTPRTDTAASNERKSRTNMFMPPAQGTHATPVPPRFVPSPTPPATRLAKLRDQAAATSDAIFMTAVPASTSPSRRTQSPEPLPMHLRSASVPPGVTQSGTLPARASTAASIYAEVLKQASPPKSNTAATPSLPPLSSTLAAEFAAFQSAAFESGTEQVTNQAFKSKFETTQNDPAPTKQSKRLLALSAPRNAVPSHNMATRAGEAVVQQSVNYYSGRRSLLAADELAMRAAYDNAKAASSTTKGDSNAAARMVSAALFSATADSYGADTVFSFSAINTQRGNGPMPTIAEPKKKPKADSDAEEDDDFASDQLSFDGRSEGGDTISSLGGLSRFGGSTTRGGRKSHSDTASVSGFSVSSGMGAFAARHQRAIKAYAPPPDAWQPVGRVTGGVLSASAVQKLESLAAREYRRTEHAMNELSSENSASLRVARRSEKCNAEVAESTEQLRQAEFESMQAMVSLPSPADMVARLYALQPPGLTNLKPLPPPRGMSF